MLVHAAVLFRQKLSLYFPFFFFLQSTITHYPHLWTPNCKLIICTYRCSLCLSTVLHGFGQVMFFCLFFYFILLQLNFFFPAHFLLPYLFLVGFSAVRFFSLICDADVSSFQHDIALLMAWQITLSSKMGTLQTSNTLTLACIPCLAHSTCGEVY